MENKYTRKPQFEQNVKATEALFAKYNLSDNPFPRDPYIEPHTSDPRRNGSIFNKKIREAELLKFYDSFLTEAFTGNHNRLGYLIESSFTGRGNGKTAFLVNIHREINEDFGYSLSKGANKLVSLYVKGLPSGETSKFWQFSEKLLFSLIDQGLLEEVMIILRLEALTSEMEKIVAELNEEVDYKKILDNGWLLTHDINVTALSGNVKKKLMDIGFEEELARKLSYNSAEASSHLAQYISLKNETWKKKSLNSIVFDSLPQLLAISGFNGCIIMLDEFEKIVESQKPSEIFDFAYEIRHNVLESNMYGASSGFYSLIITMHPGTQSLLIEAWEKSGINARSPLPAQDSLNSPEVIWFDNISKENVFLLVEEHLKYFRINKSAKSDHNLFPFTDDAVAYITELAKNNAARILKFANICLSELVRSERGVIIDRDFIYNIVKKGEANPEENISHKSFLSRDKAPIEEALKRVKFKNE